MIFGKKISRLLICIILSGVGLMSSPAVTYSQTILTDDSVNLKSQITSPSKQKKITLQEPSENFYKTDSIFSFRSPKGYIPSLLFNLKEDVIAPFHYKRKQWLI